MVLQSWKDLTDIYCLPWLEMGHQDWQRSEKEKAEYKGSWRNLCNKDPTEPKKPMSAFLKFSKERRKGVAKANPLLTGTEISSLMSRLWRECPGEIKQLYRNH